MEEEQMLEEEQVIDASYMADAFDNVISNIEKKNEILLDDKTTWAVCYNYQKDAIQTFLKFGK